MTETINQTEVLFNNTEINTSNLDELDTLNEVRQSYLTGSGTTDEVAVKYRFFDKSFVDPEGLEQLKDVLELYLVLPKKAVLSLIYTLRNVLESGADGDAVELQVGNNSDPDAHIYFIISNKTETKNEEFIAEEDTESLELITS